MKWWNELSQIETIFYIIAMPATLLLIIQSIFSLLGLADIDSDIGDLDGGDFGDVGEAIEVEIEDGINQGDGFLADFRFFTLRGLIAFFAIFGWTGAILAKKTVGIVAIIGALFAGLIAMFVVAYLFYAMTKLQGSGNIAYINAVGKVGEVYLTIPPNGQGRGKVTLTIQERLTECNALTKETVPLKTGTSVKVVGVMSDHTLIVEKN